MTAPDKPGDLATAAVEAEAQQLRLAWYPVDAHAGIPPWSGAARQEQDQWRAVARDVLPRLASSPLPSADASGPYTRAQFAAAVDDAHRVLHDIDEGCDVAEVRTIADRAHETLHRVGAGLPRVDCATPDPEAQRLRAELAAMRERALPCGHTLADLIGGTETGPDGAERPCVTKCGACLGVRQPEIEATRKARGLLRNLIVAALADEAIPSPHWRRRLEERARAFFGSEWDAAPPGIPRPPRVVASQVFDEALPPAWATALRRLCGETFGEGWACASEVPQEQGASMEEQVRILRGAIPIVPEQQVQREEVVRDGPRSLPVPEGPHVCAVRRAAWLAFSAAERVRIVNEQRWMPPEVVEERRTPCLPVDAGGCGAAAGEACTDARRA